MNILILIKLLSKHCHLAVNKQILMINHQLTLLISHILDDTCEIHSTHVADKLKDAN